MDALAEKLDAGLREWKPQTAAEARERIAEVVELADHDIFDIARSRAAEQEVLDLPMSPQPGEIWLVDLGRTSHYLSGETARMKCRYRGFRSLIVNQ